MATDGFSPTTLPPVSLGKYRLWATAAVGKGPERRGDLMGGVTALAVVVVAYTLVASRFDRWWITGPMVFVAFGAILGPGGLDVLPLSSTNETVLTITELTLALLLFSDASTVRLRQVEGDAGVPVRLLFIGLPLTIVAGALLAHLILPEADRKSVV